ncbi:MAG: hypothetical protein FJ249_11590 [Nitrospira sp.]|nr:hypothetical protein [Nitrospira sp.]
MKRVLASVLWIALLAGSGCTGNKAEELFETAQFEEKQNNQEHARQLYEEILREYPKSDAAKAADARLRELQRSK